MLGWTDRTVRGLVEWERITACFEAFLAIATMHSSTGAPRPATSTERRRWVVRPPSPRVKAYHEHVR